MPDTETHHDASLRLPNRPASFWLLCFAMLLPSAVTWIYFVVLNDAPARAQQGAYALGKTIQFALPVVWCFLVLREPWPWPRFSLRGFTLGAAFGFLVVAAMVGLYYFVLEPSGYFAVPAERILAKIKGFGVASAPAFIALGCFYALGHSGLEEYYWRWFVYRHLHARVGYGRAVLLSSMAFAAHHVILLCQYFGTDSPLAYLLGASVGIGGAVWAWLYRRAGTLTAPWFSHLIVDAGIFALGYYLARGLFHS